MSLLSSVPWASVSQELALCGKFENAELAFDEQNIKKQCFSHYKIQFFCLKKTLGNKEKHKVKLLSRNYKKIKESKNYTLYQLRSNCCAYICTIFFLLHVLLHVVKSHWFIQFCILLLSLNNVSELGSSIMAQWLRNRTRLAPMRTRVPSLALLSGLRVWHCCELWCKSQRWLGSGVAVAVA